MNNSPPSQIKIFYEKSPQYRTIHADGVWAGLSPQGGVQLAFFSDVRPTPDYTLHDLTPQGAIGNQVDKIEKDGIVRETEMMAILSPRIAEELIDILRKMLDEVARIKELPSENPS